jgi:hypothetical protein
MILRSCIDGLQRVIRARVLLFGVFVLTLVAAAPMALVVRGAIASSLGRSLAANAAADGVNYDWWQEFASQASGVAATFTPAVIGFAATLDSISSVADARSPILPIAAAVAAYLLVWLFLSGGILDRYARQRPTGAHGFFAASGVFFWRFLRLGVIAGAVYWFLFAYVHRWLLDDLYRRFTRDLAVEREAFLWRALLYVVFGLLLVAANLLVDYTKVRLVVEDRRSVIGALVAAFGFIRRRFGRVAGLYALNTLLSLAVMGVWAAVAPGAGRADWTMWAGLALTQAYVLARLMLKLQFLASQTALFQTSLAHASYTATPAPVWPQSPAAEVIGGP